MRISILGTGWLGMPLGLELAKNPEYELNGSTTTASKLKEMRASGMNAYRIDLEAHMSEAFFSCDVLIITTPPSIPEFERKVKKVIELIKENGIPKVVFISSTSVYPDLNREVTEADADYIKSSHSGVNLLAIEDLFTNEKVFQTTILRFSGLYGPGRKPGRFLAGKAGVTGANNPINLIHQEDCIQIITEIIKQAVWGETFNACADVHPTRKEFYEKAAQNLGLEPPKFSDEPALFKIVNSEKLKETLGCSFLHPNPMDDL